MATNWSLFGLMAPPFLRKDSLHERWDGCKAALKKAIALHLSPKLADDAETRLANCSEMAAQ